MTGAYFRVKRQDVWENVEVEYLTDDERKQLFGQRTPEELLRWLDAVCHTLVRVEQMVNEDGK